MAETVHGAPHAHEGHHEELGFWRNTFDFAPDQQSLVAIRAADTADRSIRIRTHHP